MSTRSRTFAIAAQIDRSLADRGEMSSKLGILGFGATEFIAISASNKPAALAAFAGLLACTGLSMYFDRRARATFAEDYEPSPQATEQASHKINLVEPNFE